MTRVDYYLTQSILIMKKNWFKIVVLKLIPKELMDFT